MVLHFSFPLAFGTPEQSIESIIGVGNHVTNGVDVGNGGGSVGDDGGGGGYGGLIVVAGHRHKVFGGKMRRLDVLLTVDTARAVGSGGGRGFHPVFRARGLSFGSPGDGAGIDWVLHLVQTLDPEGLGGMKQGWKELLGHIDFTSIGKFQHGRGFISASVFQNNDRMFARGCLENIAKIR